MSNLKNLNEGFLCIIHAKKYRHFIISEQIPPTVTVVPQRRYAFRSLTNYNHKKNRENWEFTNHNAIPHTLRLIHSSV